MFKKAIIILGLGVITVTGMHTGALAGGKGHYGYDALWWNGSTGHSYNGLFTKGHGKKAYKRKTYIVKSCTSFKKRYLKTGKKYWLRKYQVCKADQH
jgi:hypothetical protein